MPDATPHEDQPIVEALSPNQRWERDFPKTYEQAVVRVSEAQGAYARLAMPEGNFSNTPSYSLATLLRQRANQMDSQLNESPTWNNVLVPSGFEDWALAKMGLARKLWQATAMMHIYSERRMTEEEKSRISSPAEITKSPEEKREFMQVVDVMMGNFRVDIIDGKPRMKTTSYADLFLEAVQLAKKRHDKWVADHEGSLIGKFPKLSTFLELLSNSKDVLQDPTLLENIFLVHYWAYWERKLSPMKNDKL